MTSEKPILPTGAKTYSAQGDQGIFTVPDGVNTITLYGCGGGDGGRSGTVSYGYEVPGPGGRGGDGSVPQYWVEAGSVNIPVNSGDTFRILIGAGGQSDQPGGLTVVTQQFPHTGAPDKRYIFGRGHNPVTPGGVGAARGRDRSGSGAGAPDPLHAGVVIPGGEGFITFRGNQDNHWGGGGGGGGAGMSPGGRGGDGGCDGGSQGSYGGSHTPAFRAAHSGKQGSNGTGNGSGGGGGGGPGDGADDHVFDSGGPGGVGGDGFLAIRW